MTAAYDVAAIGNAIVDVIAPATDDFLVQQSMDKGAMMLVDEARSAALYTAMAPGISFPMSVRLKPSWVRVSFSLRSGSNSCHRDLPFSLAP